MQDPNYAAPLSPQGGGAGLLAARRGLADLLRRALHGRGGDAQRVLLLQDLTDEVAAAGAHVAPHLLAAAEKDERRDLQAGAQDSGFSTCDLLFRGNSSVNGVQISNHAGFKTLRKQAAILAP